MSREQPTQECIDSVVRRVHLALGDAVPPFSKTPEVIIPGDRTGLDNIAAFLDHTLLAPDAGDEDILRLCAEANTHRFAAVCVHPMWVPLAAATVDSRNIAVATVVGFPLGATMSAVKAFEARETTRAGAREIDMVIPIGALKSADYAFVFEDIQTVVEAARPAIVKVILETCLLTDSEKIAACALAQWAGAQFVKTSTGFGTAGATLHDVRLMRRVVGWDCGVKASGGIRTLEQVRHLVAAGANRIGTSASVALVAAESNGEETP